MGKCVSGRVNQTISHWRTFLACNILILCVQNENNSDRKAETTLDWFTWLMRFMTTELCAVLLHWGVVTSDLKCGWRWGYAVHWLCNQLWQRSSLSFQRNSSGFFMVLLEPSWERSACSGDWEGIVVMFPTSEIQAWQLFLPRGSSLVGCGEAWDVTLFFSASWGHNKGVLAWSLNASSHG